MPAEISKKPCGPGCRGHITHPCEKCGTQWSDNPSYQELEAENRRLKEEVTALKKIGQLIRTQDNRSTDQPMFIVQENVKVWRVHPEDAEGHIWFDSDDSEQVCDELAAKFDSYEEEGGKGWKIDQQDFEKIYFRTRWEFVTVCFTEQGCKEYIARNKHNHREELRIYGWHSFRNAEFRSVRTFIMGLEDPTEEGS